MKSHLSEPLGKAVLFNAGFEICKKRVPLTLTNCSVDKYIIKCITIASLVLLLSCILNIVLDFTIPTQEGKRKRIPMVEIYESFLNGL